MFKKCGKIMEKHVGQSSALQEIDRWSSCKFSTAGKHSVCIIGIGVGLAFDINLIPLWERKFLLQI